MPRPIPLPMPGHGTAKAAVRTLLGPLAATLLILDDAASGLNHIRGRKASHAGFNLPKYDAGFTNLNFDYQHHGEDWVQGRCASRDRQSPIDFPEMGLPADPRDPMIYHYPNISDPIEIQSDGHALNFD